MLFVMDPHFEVEALLYLSSCELTLLSAVLGDASITLLLVSHM